jgi:hypothetical protein
MALAIAPPGTDEYSDFHTGYIAAVAHEIDAVAALERQQTVIESMRRLSNDAASHRYAPGKWSVREVIGHLSDTERVMSYRLLRVARGDTTPLPAFDENTVAANSNADRRELADLVDELAAVRTSTLALVRSLEETALTRRGMVNTWPLTARALVYITAGHFQHHVNILRDRYGLHL